MDEWRTREVKQKQTDDTDFNPGNGFRLHEIEKQNQDWSTYM